MYVGAIWYCWRPSPGQRREYRSWLLSQPKGIGRADAEVEIAIYPEGLAESTGIPDAATSHGALLEWPQGVQPAGNPKVTADAHEINYHYFFGQTLA